MERERGDSKERERDKVMREKERDRERGGGSLGHRFVASPLSESLSPLIEVVRISKYGIKKVKSSVPSSISRLSVFSAENMVTQIMVQIFVT